MNEYVMLFERNFPYVIREKEVLHSLLQKDAGEWFEKRNEKGDLIAALLLHQNTVFMLCVDAAYRGQGIGTALLVSAENRVKALGFSDVVIGAGASYLAPGVPMKAPIFPSVREVPLDAFFQDCSAFFLKRGYSHAWDCNCFDLVCESLKRDTDEAVSELGLSFAAPSDREEVLAMIDAAHPSFARHYRSQDLYGASSSRRVLMAREGNTVTGALILSVDDEGVGRIGCVAVIPAFRGRGMATRLVRYATRYLALLGAKKAFVGYTYSGLERLYGKCGYCISCYYLMAKKEL